MKLVALLCLSTLSLFTSSTGNIIEFPIPPHSKKSLFYIHRSPNPNTVIYEVNLTDKSAIDSKDPVKVYWIRYGEKGQLEELNFLERNFAYGVKCEPVDKLQYKAQFVASKEKLFVVSLDDRGQARAVMKINERQSKLIKVFVQVAENGWWPKVAYVEFFGLDMENSKPTYEKMLIK